MDNIIEVNNLVKAYGDIKAVDGISFEVGRGSLFAFLGLNGAGKSTTINILCSITKKDGGRVVIDGYNLDRDADKIKQAIGIVFQSSVLDMQLTVLQNLRSRASLYGLSRADTAARIEYLTGILDLGDLLKRSYGTLSGGQKRRIDIARALIHEPKILFLDEPTTGLDPTTRVTVWRIVESLVRERGLTVFLTTHYMEEVVRADNVIILDSGRIVASGSPDDLKNRYTNDYIRLITDEDEATGAALAAEGHAYFYKNNAYYVKADGAQAVVDFLSAHIARFPDFEVIKGDMDDVFLTVTGKKLEG